MRPTPPQSTCLSFSTRTASKNSDRLIETYPASINLSEFLEAVRVEKRIELGVEVGEDWFDLVRYHFVDGFDVSTVKPTATNPDKFILPIDYVTIEAGKNVVEQNPNY